MAWTTPVVYVSGNVLTAAQMNAMSADLTDLDARTRPGSQAVAATVTTTSGSPVSLTGGPAVTILTGTAVLVSVSCSMQHSAVSGLCVFYVAVSGATTIAAIQFANVVAVNSSNGEQFGSVKIITGLTAGSNTFTMQYAQVNGTGSFSQRELDVWPANNVT